MVNAEATASAASGLLADILRDDAFFPREPKRLEETGLSATFVESLVLKYLLGVGSQAGRTIADRLGLNLSILEETFRALRTRQLASHAGSAALNDYVYTLTDAGRETARAAMRTCAYVGPAPVPLEEYITSVHAQSVRGEPIRKKKLVEAFKGLVVDEGMFENLGPAVNSGAGLFLYGFPGNGKTTLAKRITRCFGTDIWIPNAFVEDGQIVKLFDSSFHEVRKTDAESSLIKSAGHDRRWVKIVRPTVVVGGELTLDALDMRHDPTNNISEAPIQMKSNGGCLLIDDFGRQRVEPQALLNRWIVPLENRVDYQTLANGKKIQVPFEQLIIFSTNLDPADLADDAFLRRIPYKIEVEDPSLEEFRYLFQVFAKELSIAFDEKAVDELVAKHYKPHGRPLRRCQPRDLLLQIRNYCTFHGLKPEMKTEWFDRAAKSYFTVVKG